MPQPPKDVQFVSEKRIRKKRQQQKKNNRIVATTKRQNHSTIVANNQTLRGHHNRIIGNNNFVEGDHNTLVGNNNQVKGCHNRATGNNNVLEGEYNNASGNNNSFGEKCASTSMIGSNFFSDGNTGLSTAISIRVEGSCDSVNFIGGNVSLRENKVCANGHMIRAYTPGEIKEVIHDNGKLYINGEKIAIGQK